MSDEFHCPHMEECQNVLKACERKVAAEIALNVAKAEYDGKRKLMNELYAAGVAMRKAQKSYFKDKTQPNLYAAKDSEDRFDRALRACAASGKPPTPKQLKLI